MPQYDNYGYQQPQLQRNRGNKPWISKEFSASALLFWIKGKISVDYRFVRIVEKNTILGLIPAGEKRQNIPLNNITDASISTSYKVGRFIAGIILAFLGFAMFTTSILLGLLLLALGVFTFMNGIMTQLIIDKAGSSYILNVPFFNKDDIHAVQGGLERAIQEQMDKSDLNFFMDSRVPNNQSNQFRDY